MERKWYLYLVTSRCLLLDRRFKVFFFFVVSSFFKRVFSITLILRFKFMTVEFEEFGERRG